MAYQFGIDDVRYLSSTAGADSLARAADLPLTDRSLIGDLTRLRRTVGERSAAVAETVRLRRRAVAKFGPPAQDWLFTDEALQQATPGPVAEHRARRLAGVGVHDLTCSIGADLVALCAVSFTVGSDLDPVRVLMARHNLLSSGVEPRLALADALTRSSRGLLGYADPARRDTGGRRITSVSTLPAVADLDSVHADRPPVLRLPPGIDYESLDRPGEVEIVSLDGGAREAVLWPAELASVARRASVLVSAGRGGQSWEVTSDDPSDAGVAVAADSLVGEFLVDPDPAVVRAHLVRHYAARYGLRLLDPHLAYLVGPAAPASVRSFLVLDAAPYRERVVADWARRDRIGTLEIKQRGTPLIPDDLRRRLRPALKGPTSVAATLVVARIGSGPHAFWCRPVGP